MGHPLGPHTLVTLVVLLLLGCQHPPAADTVKPPAKSAAIALAEEGDALMTRGDFEAAAARYRMAADMEPAETRLRFALGTALSHLNRRAETVQQFRWVVRHGQPDSPEVQMARGWLRKVGELVEAAAPESSQGAESKSPDHHPVWKSPESAPARRMVRGRIEWNGIDPRERLIPVHVFLAGEESENREIKLARRFRLGERYEFANVPPGTYRLIAKAGETQLWDQKVAVDASQDTVLDLTHRNSPVSPDDFPGPLGQP